MVPALATAGFPKLWPTDGREGGVPDPATVGPSWIQIGTEGGFLPAPVVVPNQPVTWDLNQMDFAFGTVKDKSLMLGPAERADVIVDFSAFAGQTLIVYNDAPAAFPAIDPRYDYHTNGPDFSLQGGAPPTQPGFGPCTRTIMQIRVLPGTPVAYDLNALKQAFAKTASKSGVFEVSQPPIIVPSAMYNTAYNSTFPADTYVRIQDVDKTFTTLDGTTLTIPFENKAIHDEMGAAFDLDYGRQSGLFGVELPVTPGTPQLLILYPYISPPVEVIKDSMTPMSPVAGDGTQFWKISHNGVDSHPIHFHLFNVQLINRVGWDNIMYPPGPQRDRLEGNRQGRSAHGHHRGLAAGRAHAAFHGPQQRPADRPHPGSGRDPARRANGLHRPGGQYRYGHQPRGQFRLGIRLALPRPGP